MNCILHLGLKNTRKTVFIPHLTRILEVKIKPFCQKEGDLMSNRTKTGYSSVQFFKTTFNLSER